MSIPQTESTCVYCGAKYQEPALRCPSCALAFPWSTVALGVRSGLGNRGRWLQSIAPTVAIAASAVSIITLLVQTQILSRQTELLQEQTRTSQLDRAQTLRARIAATHTHILAARQFSDRFVWIFQPEPACEEECKSTNFFSLISSARKLTAGQRSSEASEQAQEALANLRTQLNEQAEGLATVNGTKATYGQFFTERLQPAITECGVSLDTAKSLQAASASLPIVHALIQGRHKGILERQVALLHLSNGQNLKHWTTIERDGTYTLGQLNTDLLAYLEVIRDSIDGLIETCSKRLAKDQELLKQLDAQL